MLTTSAHSIRLQFPLQLAHSILLPVLWPVKIYPLLTSESYFLTLGDPRKRKHGGLVDSDRASMAFEFGPNPMVRQEVISTGEKYPWDRK